MKKKINILVVDDLEENRYMLKSILKSKDYNVIFASNGKEALGALKAQPTDLIISDILMPEMDGFQFCRECKLNDKFKDIPFVFSTATYTDKKDEEFALSLGAQQFITKPMEPKLILKKLEEVLQLDPKEQAKSKIKFEMKEEPVYLKNYGQRVARKLEHTVNKLKGEMAEREKAESALQESEKHYHELFDLANDGIVLMQGHKFVESNQKALEIYGWSKDKVIGKTPWEISPLNQPDGRNSKEKAQSMLKEAYAGKVKHFEWLHIKEDGSLVYVEVSLNKVYLDEIQTLLVHIRDITERKQAEGALKKSEEKYRAIVENTQEWIWEIDVEGKHIFSNNFVQDVLGYSVEEFLRMNTFNLIHEDERENILLKFQSHLEKKKGWKNWVIRWRHKNGSFHYLESSAAPIFDENGDMVEYFS